MTAPRRSFLRPYYTHAELMEKRDQSRMYAVTRSLGSFGKLGAAVRSAIYGWRR